MRKLVTAEAWAAGRALYACPGVSLDDIATAMGLTVATVRRRARAAEWVSGTVDLPAEATGGRPAAATGSASVAISASGPVADAAEVRTEFSAGVASAVSQEIAAAGQGGTEVPAGVSGEAAVRGACAETEATGGGDPTDEVRLSAAALRQVDMVLAAAEAGRIDKARIDAVMAMIRLATEAANLARDGASNKKTRSDEQLADTLRRIDERIIDLAQGYAARLVAERDPC